MEDILNSYTKLNNSFKKKYIFHIGADAGFYSELSNMIFAILYCLKYEYKFILYSKDANFGYEKGWQDFFLPFCEETSFFIHRLYNKRNSTPKIRKKDYPIWLIYKILNRKTFLTYELWNKYFCKEFDKEFFDIPSLGIRGDLRVASSIILKMIYRYNEGTLNEISAFKNSITLPSEYISMQIRRGDKIIECSLLPIGNYFETATKLSGIRYLFLLTDDYTTIEEVVEKYPSWKVSTLTTPDEKGYDHEAFSRQSTEEKKQKLIKLFSSIEIIRCSNLFIGTYTTNVGLFLGMAMPVDKVISVQKKEWYRFSDDDIKEQLS